MKPTHLLDTSVLCQPIRRLPVQGVMERWRRLGESALCTSSICEAEVLQGLEAKDSPDLWARYHALLRHRIPVLPVDSRVAATCAKMAATFLRQGRPRPVLDLLIAATAKTACLTLATLNPADFTDIPGVAMEDWSAPG